MIQDPVDYARSLSESQLQATASNPTFQLPKKDSIFDVGVAALERENLAFSFFSAQTPFIGPRRAGYNGFADPQFGDLARYQEWWSRLVPAAQHSPQAMQDTIAQFDRELENRRLVSSNGITGWLAAIGAGISSPENFVLPLGAVGKVRQGAGILDTMAATARTGFVAAGVAELGLQNTQITRELSESAANVVASTLFAGIVIGAPIGALGQLGVVQRNLVRNVLHRELSEGPLSERVEAKLPDGFYAMGEIERQRRIVMDVLEVVDKDAFELAKGNGLIGAAISGMVKLNPGGRLASGRTVVERLLGAKLSRTGIWQKGTAKLGQSTEAKKRIFEGFGAIARQEQQDIYQRYMVEKARADGGVNTLSREDFNRELFRTLWRDDEASQFAGGSVDRTFLEEAAKAARERLYDPFLAVGEATGLFSRNEVPVAKGYATTVLDKVKIRQDPVAFIDWLNTKGFDRSTDDAKQFVMERLLNSRSDILFDHLREPGPFKEIMLKIPREDLLDGGWVVTDFDAVVQRYVNATAGDLAMALDWRTGTGKLLGIMDELDGLNTRLQGMDPAEAGRELTLMRDRMDDYEAGYALSSRLQDETRKAAERLEGLADDRDRLVRKLAEVERDRPLPFDEASAREVQGMRDRVGEIETELRLAEEDAATVRGLGEREAARTLEDAQAAADAKLEGLNVPKRLMTRRRKLIEAREELRDLENQAEAGLEPKAIVDLPARRGAATRRSEGLHRDFQKSNPRTTDEAFDDFLAADPRQVHLTREQRMSEAGVQKETIDLTDRPVADAPSHDPAQIAALAKRAVPREELAVGTGWRSGVKSTQHFSSGYNTVMWYRVASRETLYELIPRFKTLKDLRRAVKGSDGTSGAAKAQQRLLDRVEAGQIKIGKLKRITIADRATQDAVHRAIGAEVAEEIKIQGGRGDEAVRRLTQEAEVANKRLEDGEAAANQRGLEDEAARAEFDETLAPVTKELEALNDEVKKLRKLAHRVGHKDSKSSLDRLTKGREPIRAGNEDDVASRLKALEERAATMRRTESRDAASLVHYLRKNGDEYEELARAEPNARKRAKLERLRERRHKDIEGIRNVIMNIENYSDDPMHWVFSAERSLKKLAFITRMGKVMISSIPDMAMHVFVNGWTPYMRSVAQVMRDPDFLISMKSAKNRDELIWMISALETHLGGSRLAKMSDIDDPGAPSSGVEAALTYATEVFTTATGMRWWQPRQKTVAAMGAQNRIAQDVHDWVLKGKLSRSAETNLELAGIDERLARAFVVEMQRVKGLREKISGTTVWWPQSNKWRDPGLRQAWQAAVLEDVERTIITPSAADRPLIMSKPFARLALQFKSFAIAANNKITVSGLQRADGAVLSGITGMLTMGAMVYALRGILSGRELSDDPRVWIVEAVDRSGATGILMEFNNILERITMGRFGVNPLVTGTNRVSTRYQARNVFDIFLGPTAGLAADIFRITSSPFKQDGFNEGDLERLRRMTPGMELWYLSRLSRIASENLGEAAGLERVAQ